MPPNLEAVVPTTEVAAAAADEVSSALAELFTANARAYPAVSAQAAQFHQEFVRALSAGAAPMRPRKPPMPTRCSCC
nr:PE family protein [Mycobacterium szulgai]